MISVLIYAGPGNNGSLSLWDYNTGVAFQNMEDVPQPGSLEAEAGVFCSTFDMTGTRLITGGADKTIKVRSSRILLYAPTDFLYLSRSTQSSRNSLKVWSLDMLLHRLYLVVLLCVWQDFSSVYSWNGNLAIPRTGILLTLSTFHDSPR